MPRSPDDSCSRSSSIIASAGHFSRQTIESAAQHGVPMAAFLVPVSNAAEIAMVYAALGDKAQAMAWLDRGYRERFNPGGLLRPGFDSLRADPGFRDLVNRVGLTR